VFEPLLGVEAVPSASPDEFSSESVPLPAGPPGAAAPLGAGDEDPPSEADEAAETAEAAGIASFTSPPDGIPPDADAAIGLRFATALGRSAVASIRTILSRISSH
jgi:hypothetical protein